MHSRVVGLTGGIASGKSTVARAFGALGVPVIDADQLAREVVMPGSPALAEICAAFGADLVLPDGTLDRKALGARVFGDAAALATLNRLTHPRIAALSASRIAASLATGAAYVMYEAALIVENGLERTMGALVVVSVRAEVQVARLMAREGMSERDARARLAAQAPLSQKLAAANHVIDNNGAVSALPDQVRRVHEALLSEVAPR